MKLPALLLLTLPFHAFSQSRQDYEATMSKFVRFYNQQQADSLCALFSLSYQEGKNCFWKTGLLKPDTTIYQLYGKITYFKSYVIDKSLPGERMLFGVGFEKQGQRGMTFQLVDNKLENFHFDTLSPELKEIIAKGN